MEVHLDDVDAHFDVAQPKQRHPAANFGFEIQIEYVLRKMSKYHGF